MATATAARPAAGVEPARASSPKTLWVGVAAAVVIAAVALGAMLLRGRGSSHSAADAPNVTNLPPPRKDAPRDPNAGDNTVTPTSKNTSASRRTTPQPPTVNASADPIVGCYQWFNNAPVAIRPDGAMTAGPFTAHWRVLDASRHAYTFTWPLMIETLTISPDQRSMTGGNQYGYPISGTRTGGVMGLAGTWQWSNGWTVSVSPNGAFTSGSFRGTWRAVDVTRGVYEMTWPGPVDSVLLLGGTQITGKNQYGGIAITGVKTGACSGN